MALSNWVSFALYTDEPFEASHSRSFGDDTAFVVDSIEAEVYKNWVYIRHPDAWFDGNGFKEPTISEITKGDVRYGPLRITAERGPQKGVYVLFETGYRHEDTHRAMAAVGAFEEEKWSWDGLSADARRYFAEFIEEQQVSISEFEYTGRDEKESATIKEVKAALRGNELVSSERR